MKRSRNSYETTGCQNFVRHCKHYFLNMFYVVTHSYTHIRFETLVTSMEIYFGVEIGVWTVGAKCAVGNSLYEVAMGTEYIRDVPRQSRR